MNKNNNLDIRNSKQIRITKMQNKSINQSTVNAPLFVLESNARRLVNCFENY